MTSHDKPQSTHELCTGPRNVEWVPGVATGIRCFSVHEEDGVLRGVAHSYFQYGAGENQAECDRKPLRRGGRCSNLTHGCGIWAYHDGSVFEQGAIVGVIHGYGRTTVGTKGFRCDKARIIALALPRPIPGVGNAFLGITLWNLATALVAPFYGRWWLSGAALATALVSARIGVWAVDKNQRRVPRELAAKIRANYPNVPVYSSVERMKLAHPIDAQLAPGGSAGGAP